MPPSPLPQKKEFTFFEELAILSEWWESFLHKGLRSKTGTDTWHYLMKFCKSKTPSLKDAELFQNKMTTAASNSEGLVYV
jgi:hypothetical protein